MIFSHQTLELLIFFCLKDAYIYKLLMLIEAKLGNVLNLQVVIIVNRELGFHHINWSSFTKMAVCGLVHRSLIRVVHYFLCFYLFRWMLALKREITRVKTKMLLAETPQENEKSGCGPPSELFERKLCINRIRQLPGNASCADCSSTEGLWKKFVPFRSVVFQMMTSIRFYQSDPQFLVYSQIILKAYVVA